MSNLIIQTLTMLLSSASLLLLFIATLYLLQKYACKIAVNCFGGKVIYISAIIGTPIHELSHALVCVPFRHQINKIVFFGPDGSGTLGFVEHSFNPRSLWQVIGNFFIGVAPLFGGAVTIALLTEFLLPNGASIVSTNMLHSSTFASANGVTSFITALYNHMAVIISLLKASFTTAPVKTSLWFYLTAAVALHMSPSPADVKGAVKGFFALIALVAAAQFLMSLNSYGDPMRDFYDGLEQILIPISVSFTLCIALAGSLTLFLLAISLLFRKY